MDRPPFLLSDAETPEDPAEQVLARYLARDLAESALGVGEFLRNELAGVALGEQAMGFLDVRPRPPQRVEVVRSELDAYSCRHGLSYSVISGARNGIAAEALFFVPLGTWAEVLQLTLTNTSDTPRALTVFSLVEWCLWNAHDDLNNLQRNLSVDEVEIDGSTIYHTTEYRERRDHYAFYAVNAPLAAFDTDRDAFLGAYNGFDRPAAVVEGRPRDSVAHGWSPIASHCLAIDLAPGEARTLVFVLGYVENPAAEKWERPGVVQKARARTLIERFDTPAKV